MYAYAKVQIDPSTEAHSAGDGPDYIGWNLVHKQSQTDTHTDTQAGRQTDRHRQTAVKILPLHDSMEV